MRQVNGWGFKRITQGPDHNSYYHELFLRGLPRLVRKMKRPTKARIHYTHASSEGESTGHANFYYLRRISTLSGNSVPQQSAVSSSENASWSSSGSTHGHGSEFGTSTSTDSRVKDPISSNPASFSGGPDRKSSATQEPNDVDGNNQDRIENSGGAGPSQRVVDGSGDNNRVSQQVNPMLLYPVLGGVAVMPPPVAPIVQYSPAVHVPYELGQQLSVGGGQPMLNQPPSQLLRVVNHVGAEVGYIQLPTTSHMGQTPIMVQNQSFPTGQFLQPSVASFFPQTVQSTFHPQPVNQPMQHPQSMFVLNPQMMGFYGPQTPEGVFQTTTHFQPNEHSPPM
jgi:hypothetical protein